PVRGAEQQSGSQGERRATHSALLASARRPDGRRRLIGRDGLPSSHSCGLNRMSAERTAVATRTSCWLRPVCSKVTTPSPGRLAEGRLAATTVAAYRVSPWNSGVGKVIF